MGKELMERFRRIYASAHDLVAERGLDRHHEKPYPRLHQFAHFWVLVVKSFLRNKCPLRATALSYSTLLALVPLLAIGASITSGVLQERGHEATQDLIRQFIKTVAPQLEMLSQSEAESGETGDNPETASASPGDKSAAKTDNVDAGLAVVQQINKAIENFHSKTIGVTGLIGFIAVALLLLTTIEGTFNDIWGVTTGRAWFRRLVQYWAAITLGPLILVAALLLTKTSEFSSVQEYLADKPFFSIGLKLVPFITISLGFGLFYKLMPNTQVHWRAALVAGFVGGSLWWLNNLISAANLGRVITMSKLYGPLALVPLFLIGLYFSWLIMLFGAQVGYALQNRKIYLQEKKAEGLSQRSREFIALRVMLDIAQRFELQTRPPTILELSSHLGIPSRLASRLLQPLITGRLVVEVSEVDAAYVPARSLETITCHDVIEALRAGVDVRKELETEDEPTKDVLREEFFKIQDAEEKVAAALSMKQLVLRAAPQLVPLSKRPELKLAQE